MKFGSITILMLAAVVTASADFSYTTTRKSSQGQLAAAAGPQTTKQYFKGQKMKTDSGDTATIIDMDAQTITNIDNKQKTYTVMNFGAIGQAAQQAGVEAKIDVRETGQRRNINGYNASETMLTMEMDSPESRQAGMKMQMEMSVWASPDVPGAADLRAFYQRNANRFASMTSGAGAGMQKAMAEMQRKMSNINGVPVLQVIKLKPAGNSAQMGQAQQQMAQAMAQLEAMKKQGGTQAAAAEAAMARMGGMAGGGGSLFEITMESSEFSAAPIPDSAFAIPAGYQKK